jgi:hypothetical protein
MRAATSAATTPARPPAATLLAGGLVVGTLDLLFAWGYWARHGATLPRILQSIAEGWYGKASYDMGTMSAVVGAVSHYFIAIVFVVAYWLAARRLPGLLAHPYRYGLAYGLLLYAAMNFVVLPLSAAGMPAFANHAWVGASIVAHALLGVVCALFARISSGRG